MNYRRFINHESTSFTVNDHLVECGKTTWQISNIAATSIGKRELHNKEPEPMFTEPEPKLDLPWKLMVGVSVGVAISSQAVFKANVMFWVALALSVGAFVYVAIQKKERRTDQWQKSRALVQRQWAIWDEMRRNPPVLYSLKLETNAGSRSLFYSWDEDVIVKTRNAISDAMSKKKLGTVAFNIDTINVGAEESINNFGSQIYQQSISEVNNGNGHQ